MKLRWRMGSSCTGRQGSFWIQGQEIKMIRGATLSAGRLVVEDGILKAVWPHSGHYLPTEENFEQFILFLKEHKVDLSTRLPLKITTLEIPGKGQCDQDVQE